jgi:hypothetical protein
LRALRRTVTFKGLICGSDGNIQAAAIGGCIDIDFVGVDVAGVDVVVKLGRREDAKMRGILALAAMVGLIVTIGAPITATNAAAASPRCVAFCTNWCAKNFAMKNTTACSERCQLKHCK